MRAGLFLVAVVVAGCAGTTESSLFGPVDASSAGTDASGTGDTGAPDAGSSRDVGSTADAPHMAKEVTYACNNPASVVDDCAMCGGNPLGCLFCGPSTLTGVCLQGGLTCGLHVPAGYNTCACQTGADCPIPTQVCITGTHEPGCSTCGSRDSDGLPCKQAGTKCNAATGFCD